MGYSLDIGSQHAIQALQHAPIPLSVKHVVGRGNRLDGFAEIARQWSAGNMHSRDSLRDV